MKTLNFLQTILAGLLVFQIVACQRFGALPKEDKKAKLANTDEVIKAAAEEEADLPLKGAPLGEAAQLHKLSMALRGIAPSTAEYQELKKAAAEEKSGDYLAAKAKEYLQTEAFIERMVIKLDELFYFRNTSQREPLIPAQKTNSSSDSIQFSSTDNIFRDIFTKNLSWDTLLTGKSYRLPDYAGEIPDLKFYRNVLDLPAELDSVLSTIPSQAPTGSKEIRFEDSDPRIAGAITSPRFFSRYTATSLNKNRRRAAAIFRVFLCDPMVSSIPETHDAKSLANLIFPEGAGVTEEQVIQSTEALHGTQADCMSCHYKLDPLGLSLRESPLVLNDQPSPGRLVFKNFEGKMISQAGAGIGEVAKSISEQPDYTRCQVETFWNWFIGADVPLTKKTRAQLTESFDRMDHRAGDFVAYLVSRPEFKMRLTQDPERLMTIEAKNFLKRCDSCHDGVRMEEDIELPSFANWPIGGNSAKTASWLKKIAKSLDLKNQGKNRTMPTAMGFKPTAEELTNLQKWIEQGAPNERGEKMVTP